jgi:hypothetical protein
VTGENPSDNGFFDWDVESQGNLLSNSRTAPSGIALLCFDNGFNELFVRAVWAGEGHPAGMGLSGKLPVLAA